MYLSIHITYIFIHLKITTKLGLNKFSDIYRLKIKKKKTFKIKNENNSCKKYFTYTVYSIQNNINMCYYIYLRFSWFNVRSFGCVVVSFIKKKKKYKKGIRLEKLYIYTNALRSALFGDKISKYVSFYMIYVMQPFSWCCRTPWNCNKYIHFQAGIQYTYFTYLLICIHFY